MPAGGVAAVFADLNRGEDVTKGLRKVDKNEMTHKNPALRAGGVVSSNTGSSPGQSFFEPFCRFLMSVNIISWEEARQANQTAFT